MIRLWDGSRIASMVGRIRGVARPTCAVRNKYRWSPFGSRGQLATPDRQGPRPACHRQQSADRSSGGGGLRRRGGCGVARRSQARAGDRRDHPAERTLDHSHNADDATEEVTFRVTPQLRESSRRGRQAGSTRLRPRPGSPGTLPRFVTTGPMRYANECPQAGRLSARARLSVPLGSVFGRRGGPAVLELPQIHVSRFGRRLPAAGRGAGESVSDVVDVLARPGTPERVTGHKSG